MASILTPTNGAIDPPADGTLAAALIIPQECAYCRSLLVTGQRWVREKIYGASAENGPHYRRYHADLFVDEELSCWEKHEMELEIARATRAANRVM